MATYNRQTAKRASLLRARARARTRLDEVQARTPCAHCGSAMADWHNPELSRAWSEVRGLPRHRAVRRPDPPHAHAWAGRGRCAGGRTPQEPVRLLSEGRQDPVLVVRAIGGPHIKLGAPHRRAAWNIDVGATQFRPKLE